jgi:hypothetical protein
MEVRNHVATLFPERLQSLRTQDTDALHDERKADSPERNGDAGTLLTLSRGSLAPALHANASVKILRFINVLAFARSSIAFRHRRAGAGLRLSTVTLGKHIGWSYVGDCCLELVHPACDDVALTVQHSLKSRFRDVERPRLILAFAAFLSELHGTEKVPVG